MRWLSYSTGLLASVFFAITAFAQDLPPIRSQIILGEYSNAYEQAKDIQTADGQALAAEILLSEIMLGKAEKNKKQAKKARKQAEAALEFDPSHQNARLQYAIADGFVTRETGNVSAWMKKLPQKTHGIIETYQADFPADPRGDALMGAWHLAVVRKAGNKNAQKWFDASITKGRALFLAARKEEPGDIIIGVNYAFSLLGLEDEDLPGTEEALQVLHEIGIIKPSTHLESVLQGYAYEALGRIEDRDVVREYVGMFLDGKTPE